MFKPTIEDINHLLEERSSFYIAWSKEDQITFDNEIFELRQEFKNYYSNKAKINDEEEKDNFYIEDDQDINIESQDDIISDIDITSSYDNGSPLLYTKKDKIFFFFTSAILLLNGFN